MIHVFVESNWPVDGILQQFRIWATEQGEIDESTSEAANQFLRKFVDSVASSQVYTRAQLEVRTSFDLSDV